MICRKTCFYIRINYSFINSITNNKYTKTKEYKIVAANIDDAIATAINIHNRKISKEKLIKNYIYNGCGIYKTEYVYLDIKNPKFI